MPLRADYTSKTPDASGRFSYTAKENDVWQRLYTRQMASLGHHACAAWLDGRAALGIFGDAVPQVADVDRRLSDLTGAGAEPVDALIPQDAFSRLLSRRRFPVANFIRRPEHFDYIEEPDIFHECFGHCPMMANEHFCRFVEEFGRAALALGQKHSAHLFRLFWFTVEFGLIREQGARKAFGAGIMSSPGELAHAMSEAARVVPFDLMTVLRTPYRIDILQPVYFEISSFAELAVCLEQDLETVLEEAKARGDLEPLFDAAA
ncbi:phenylalanine 4-monooxygenase [Roseobacter ponti]|uniref:Phenylalanine 4-monooxygenase n=1 Tax=Roseobacter ponti TaxID=1891787 RepID=A0A858SN79_9RHOB|nr:phenylalanine 4-monooxygenase [Roseobacter ponti]QJF49920.1 phenylalanine 4-monooxygenase [Roseobacter ponti]